VLVRVYPPSPPLFLQNLDLYKVTCWYTPIDIYQSAVDWRVDDANARGPVGCGGWGENKSGMSGRDRAPAWPGWSSEGGGRAHGVREILPDLSPKLFKTGRLDGLYQR
jgi:hypothetical protein